MEDLENINITLSSWPGTGATTLSLILANLLHRKCINMGNVFRYLGLNLGFSNEGIDRPEFDNYIENIIGPTIDNYVDYILLNESNLIVEADIAAFRLGKHPKIFSIFVKADRDNRIQRLMADNREDAIVTLEKRDDVLRQKYKQLWNTDFFDDELISKKYNFVLDNSNMSINHEVHVAIDALKSYMQFKNISEQYWEEVESKIEEFTDLFEKEGKQYLIDLLEKDDLESNAKETITEITKLFPEDVNNFPDNIKTLFFKN